MNHAPQLPAGFEMLEPFSRLWSADTAAGRAHCRDSSDEASRLAFYEAARDAIPKALAYLDERTLKQLDERELRLMHVVLSFAHVALAVELQREEEPRHARYRAYMRITRATADQ
jgi:hypothetical protein